MDEVKGNGNVFQTSLPQQPGFSHKCLAGSGPFCKRMTRPVRLPAVGPWVILSHTRYDFFFKLWGSEKKEALHNKLVTSGWDRTNDLAVNGRTLCRFELPRLVSCSPKFHGPESSLHVLARSLDSSMCNIVHSSTNRTSCG